MKLLAAAGALAALSLIPAGPPNADRVLDVTHHPVHGIVELSAEAGGRTLIVTARGGGTERRQRLELDRLADGAAIVAARVAPMMERGVAIAIAAETRAASDPAGHAHASYHTLVTADLRFVDRVLSGDELRRLHPGWFLGQAFHVHDGAAYRIADVHAHGGGDAIEVNLRRGFVDPQARRPALDQLLFVDRCPVVDPAVAPGRSRLLRTVLED